MKNRDGVLPDCETERGCYIPPLTAGESRVLSMRETLLQLRGIVDSASVLKFFCATREDLELLAIVEEEIFADRETEKW